MPSLTTANSIITLAIAGLFSTPQQLTQYAADDIFSTEALESAETSMGVDGILSGGYVNVPVKQSITLQANSPSIALFDQWFTQQRAQQDVFTASGVVILKGLGSKWTLMNGFLTSYPPIPDGGKILKPRKFGITWQSVAPAVSS